MKTNISKPDRLIRLIVSIVLIIVSQKNITEDPLLDIILLVLGIYLFLTVLINYCIMYAFLDFSSANNKKSRRKQRNFL